MSVLANRLRKRHRHLRKWARRSGVTCYRLYERDIPDAPCIVDWYDGEAVVWLSLRKRDETPEQDAAWREYVVEEVCSGLDLPIDKVFVKARERQKGLNQYERLAQHGHVRVVEENGLRFEVNLSDYVDTGLFLDHRGTRALVREAAAGKDVLNLFAYTGSFTVYAADGNARSTTTVDMSRTYCDWAARNLKLNGFSSSEAEGASHRIHQGDCLAFLAADSVGSTAWDVIVCDPPTFSNSKRMTSGSFSVDRDHPWLLRHCARLLRPGGVLFFSTNSRRFKLEPSALPPFIATEITERIVPEDFRNRRSTRCWRVEGADSV